MSTGFRRPQIRPDVTKVTVHDARRPMIVFAVARPQSTGEAVKPPPLNEGQYSHRNVVPTSESTSLVALVPSAPAASFGLPIIFVAARPK